MESNLVLNVSPLPVPEEEGPWVRGCNTMLYLTIICFLPNNYQVNNFHTKTFFLFNKKRNLLIRVLWLTLNIKCLGEIKENSNGIFFFIASF